MFINTLRSGVSTLLHPPHGFACGSHSVELPLAESFWSTIDKEYFKRYLNFSAPCLPPIPHLKKKKNTDRDTQIIKPWHFCLILLSFSCFHISSIKNFISAEYFCCKFHWNILHVWDNNWTRLEDISLKIKQLHHELSCLISK